MLARHVEHAFDRSTCRNATIDLWQKLKSLSKPVTKEAIMQTSGMLKEDIEIGNQSEIVSKQEADA